MEAVLHASVSFKGHLDPAASIGLLCGVSRFDATTVA
jgi:hypothetical protein